MIFLQVDTPPDTEIDLESDSTSREASSPEKGFKGELLSPSIKLNSKQNKNKNNIVTRKI